MTATENHTENIASVESQDGLLGDERFWDDEDYLCALIDAINHNFVLEVKASQDQDK